MSHSNCNNNPWRNLSPALSIITVSLNNLEGLRKTLCSIAEQNVCHEELLEWIVIDGGSNDGTLNFLKSLEPTFPFVYISEKDGGVFDAMNKGIKSSLGSYLFFLNSGDVFSSKDVLSRISNYMSSQPPRLVSGLVQMTYKNKSRTSDLKPWVCHQSVFIPRSLISEYMFDETLKYFGDLDLWKRLDRDGYFDVQRLDVVVAKFELGGLGNSPDLIFKRLKERCLIGSRYQDKVPYLVRWIYCMLLYGIFRTGGRDAYFKFLIN